MRFTDKICLVTGGGSGIGRAACLQLAAEGGTVVVLDRDETTAQDTTALITKGGGQARAIRVDLGLAAEIEAAMSTVAATYGRVDVLVNNAAMMTFKPISELSVDEWDLVMAVNLRAVFHLSKLCLPHMRGGAIVNISSVHAQETTANVIPYAASKGALEAFTRGMSQEYPAAHVRTNCVAPGAVDTPMLWNNPNVKSGKEKIEGEVGHPEDIAGAICYLASAEAHYINGTTLVVDGGRLSIL
ncbi:SDR family NAD(P)-dependent oxidoreductase [Hymenobacter metallilatus]|uniref:SDR family oxidoreductase n=1 Tax=Hymenobacter metallilatus TaxID=2493666 RepID=A0A428IZ31_9BACT|nr:SDR family oxidoreductase [Hymenobacter metallilatus]RSK24578.1 SDR family oxidoreductase [Hymenobacter metallilatus]